MAKKAHKFVIVGLGSIGCRHLSNLRKLTPDAQIAILRRKGSAPKDAETLADHIFYSIQEAIDFSPDMAVVASPASYHLQVAMEFAKASVPLFIEKPLSNSQEGLAEFQDYVERHDIPNFVAYNFRFNHALLKFKDLLQNGQVGKVLSVRAEVGQYLPNWRFGTDYRQGVSAQSSLGGGALLELSHELDYLVWLFSMPDKVYCQGGHRSHLEIDVEDIAELMLHYPHAPYSISVALDFLQPTATRSCKVIGDKGTMVWDALENRLTIDMIDGHHEDMVLGASDRNEVYLDEMRHFLDVLEHGVVSNCDINQAADIMRLIGAAKKSMNAGSLVDV